jgi:hypothetical protein
MAGVRHEFYGQFDPIEVSIPVTAWRWHASSMTYSIDW